MPMTSRWDLLLDKKPVPLIEHLLDEAAKFFTDQLSAWPPELLELDLPTGRETAALIEATPKRPRDQIWHEAFELARWDLNRDFEIFDEYMRNRRYLEKGLSEAERPLVLFLSRLLTEHALGLNEATQGKVNREKMVELLHRTEKRLLGPSSTAKTSPLS
jgi:hypothetical protein